MQQPPAQTQVSPVRLKVVSIGLFKVVVVVVLEAYPRFLVRRWRGSKGNDGSEVVAAAEEVQLDAGQKCEKGQCV